MWGDITCTYWDYLTKFPLEEFCGVKEELQGYIATKGS